MVGPDTLTDVLRATPEEDGVQLEGNTSNTNGDSASEILSTRHTQRVVPNSDSNFARKEKAWDVKVDTHTTKAKYCRYTLV
jgi:hypothetical protein